MSAAQASAASSGGSARFGEELVRAAVQRARDLVELTAAEARLAALSGLAMLLFVMVAAAALVVAWVLLVACVLFLFAQTSLGWPIPALFIAAAHAVLAWYLWQATVRLSWNLTLPEVRVTLAAKPPAPEVPDGGLVADRPT
jgi:hypothetical protein